MKLVVNSTLSLKSRAHPEHGRVIRIPVGRSEHEESDLVFVADDLATRRYFEPGGGITVEQPKRQVRMGAGPRSVVDLTDEERADVEGRQRAEAEAKARAKAQAEADAKQKADDARRGAEDKKAGK